MSSVSGLLGPERAPSALAIALGTAAAALLVGAAVGRGLLAGVAALLVVSGGLWVISRPRAAALAMVAVVPAISGLARGLPVPGVRLAEIVAFGTSVLLLATAPRARWRAWRSLDWIALTYVVATFGLGIVTTLGRGDAVSANDLGQLTGPLLFLLLYRAVLVTLHDRRDRLRALELLLLGSIPVSVLAIAQGLGVPGISNLLVLLTGENWSYLEGYSVRRVWGPFPHFTMLAAYLFAIITICGALLLAGVRGRRLRIVQAAIAPAAVALVLTVTLAPMIGALVAPLAVAIWYRRAGSALTYIAIAAIALAIAFMPLLQSRAADQFGATSQGQSLVPYTVAKRAEFWRDQYLPVLEGRWIAGYGPKIPPEVSWKHTESVYITMLLRGGLLLLVIYLALMVSAASIAHRVARSSPRPDDDAASGARAEVALARAMVVLVAVLAIIQLTAPYFTTTGLPHLWWIVAALVAGAAEDARRGALGDGG